MIDTGFSLHVWGARGSYPAPGAATVAFGGNTPCVEVRAAGHTIILDAGTGIIGLGRALAARARQAGTPVEALLLFSHLHHDHTQGFPFFGPAYFPSAHLHCFGPEMLEDSLESVLARNQTPPMFPVMLRDMGSAKDFRAVQDGDVIHIGGLAEGIRVGRNGHNAPGHEPAGGITIRVQRSHAHPGGVLFYRIECGGRALVYATDTEGYVGTDRRLVSFARGADLLIHDAQYTEEHYRGTRHGFPATQGYGHSTAAMACEVAAAAGVARLLLFHHDPSSDDEAIRGVEVAARALFPRTDAAYEGQEIRLDGAQEEIGAGISTAVA